MKFKAGDEVELHNFDSRFSPEKKYRAIIEQENPEHANDTLGMAYRVAPENPNISGIWNEKYIRKLTKLEKALK